MNRLRQRPRQAAQPGGPFMLAIGLAVGQAIGQALMQVASEFVRGSISA